MSDYLERAQASREVTAISVSSPYVRTHSTHSLLLVNTAGTWTKPSLNFGAVFLRISLLKVRFCGSSERNSAKRVVADVGAASTLALVIWSTNSTIFGRSRSRILWSSSLKEIRASLARWLISSRESSVILG